MVKRVRVVKSAIQRFKLKSTGRAFHESPGIREETGEKVYEIESARGRKGHRCEEMKGLTITPLRRSFGPDDFWSGGSCVISIAGTEAVLPSQILLLNRCSFWSWSQG
jgi:hypothetical protein